MIRKFPCFLPGHGNGLVLKRGKIHNVKSLACVADAWAIQSAKMNGSKGGGSVDVHEGREEATSFSLRLYPSIVARSFPIFESPYNTKCINYYFQITSERTLYYHKTIWKTINNNLYEICASNRIGNSHIAARIFIRLQDRLFRAFFMYVTFSAFPEVNLYTNSRDKLKQGAHGKLAGPRGTFFRIKQNT